MRESEAGSSSVRGEGEAKELKQRKKRITLVAPPRIAEVHLSRQSTHSSMREMQDLQDDESRELRVGLTGREIDCSTSALR